MEKNFIERLMEDVSQKSSRVLVGLDPVIESMPESFVRPILREKGNNNEGCAEAIWIFNKKLIEGLADIAVAFKPQIAFYEAYGIAGMQAYSRTLKAIREHGILAIGDIKRGDIGSTAEAYATGHLGHGSEFEADAVTVNPYLGIDSIRPFLKYVDQNGKGLFVLAKTSNSSSSEFQDLDTIDQKCSTNIKLYQRVSAKISEWGKNSISGNYSSVGAVVGATHPSTLSELRKMYPHIPFLIPGYGAQGATAKDIIHGFDSNGHGAIVNSSRGIIFAGGKDTSNFVSDARIAAIKMRDEIENALKG